jgi:hypothetical protein
MTQQQSPAELAKQFGGRPVADIAAQFGGKPVDEPATSAQPTPGPKQMLTAKLGDFLKKAYIDTPLDVSKGILKGGASTVLGASQLISRGTEAIGLSKPVRPEVWDVARRDFATPEGTAQKIGFGAEQIAEFMIPFGGQAKAAAMAPKGVTLAARGTRYAMRSAGEAAETATKAAVQSGGDPGEIVTAALLGGTTPTIARTVAAAGKAITHRLPEELYQRIFKLTEDEWQAAVRAEAKGAAPNQTLAREVLERGLRGDSKAMAITAIKKLDDYEGQLKQHLAGKFIPIPQKAEYIKLLDAVADEFGGAFSSVGKEAKALSLRLKVFGQGNDVIASDALKLKRLLDRSRSASTFKLSPKLSPRQEEYKRAADMVRGRLHLDQTASELLNNERVFIEALDSITEYAVRQGNRPLVDMLDRLAVMGGLTAPLLTGPAVATTVGVRAARSPFVLTNLGQTLHSLRFFAPKETTATTIARGATQPVVSGGR